MAARQRTTLVGECAERVRNAEAELDAARRELEVALREHGWQEVQRHTPTGGAATVIYQRDDAGQIDPISGMPAGDVRIACFDDFVRGEAE